MASRRRIWRNKFDERYEFVAVRQLRFTEQVVSAGEIVDKALTTPRRLRQLYDARWIDVATNPQVAACPSAPAPSDPVDESSHSLAGSEGPIVDAPEPIAEPEPAAPSGYVPLPADWRERSAMDIRRMAEAVTGEKINSRATAIERLEEYDRARPA
jgi:hypothetical protein